jgi:hypothetical protein
LSVVINIREDQSRLSFLYLLAIVKTKDPVS